MHLSQTPRLVWQEWWRNPGLLEEKQRLLKTYQDVTSSVSTKPAYNNICKTVQSRLSDMQDSCVSKKVEQIQSFADRKYMKKFHDALKQFIVQRALEPPHFSVQMEAHSDR